MVTPQKVICFVKKRGIILESGKGSVPSLTEFIAGKPIHGSWWAHPKSHHIYSLIQCVRESKNILVCRLVDGKITYVHQRIWPALVRLASHFDRSRLAWIHEVHTDKGHHVVRTVPFPKWLPVGIKSLSKKLSEETALSQLRGNIKVFKFHLQLN